MAPLGAPIPLWPHRALALADPSRTGGHPPARALISMGTRVEVGKAQGVTMACPEGSLATTSTPATPDTLPAATPSPKPSRGSSQKAALGRKDFPGDSISLPPEPKGVLPERGWRGQTREALREGEPRGPSRSFRLWPRNASTGTPTQGFVLLVSVTWAANPAYGPPAAAASQLKGQKLGSMVGGNGVGTGTTNLLRRGQRQGPEQMGRPAARSGLAPGV